MAKKKMCGKAMIKCQCSTCGQIAHAVQDSQHVFCTGVKVMSGKQLPRMFANLRNPNNRGTWKMYVAQAPIDGAIDPSIMGMAKLTCEDQPSL